MATKTVSKTTKPSDPVVVESYMSKLKHPLKDEAEELRQIILSADKTIGEEIAWNAPCFFYTGALKPFKPKEYKRFIVVFNFFKKDCIRIIFLRGALVSDKYKCRRCNIAFVWNTPNNPWDMIPYVEKFVSDMEEKIAAQTGADNEEVQATTLALEQMKANLAKLKPVVDASDLDLKELQEREVQMADMVHKFKKHLMIEKIRMEE